MYAEVCFFLQFTNTVFFFNRSRISQTQKQMKQTLISLYSIDEVKNYDIM